MVNILSDFVDSGELVSLVGFHSDKKSPFYAWIVCPKCDDGFVINIARPEVELKKDEWRIKYLQGGKFNLYPSIIHKDCGAHFWVVNGKITPCT